MSEDRRPVTLAKWPFYLADLVLSGVVVFVLYQLGTFEGATEMVIVAVCLVVAAVAAWLSILPWLKEHEAAVHLNESSNLKSSLEQIKGIEKVADLIRQSNSQWQSIQDVSTRTVNSAREITERMKVEADEFMKFMSQAHDQERAGLRLELEKLRRMEGDWIKVAVQMLDHIYALFRAAERSGQRHLIAQLSQFQNACRDVARRMGLSPFVPKEGELFDSRAHQLPDGQTPVPEGALIGGILAVGFTYQGQLLRRSLVVLEGARETLPEGQTATVSEEPPITAAQSETEPVVSATSESEPDIDSLRPSNIDSEPQVRANELAESTEPSSVADVAADVDVFESVDDVQMEPPSEPSTPEATHEPSAEGLPATEAIPSTRAARPRRKKTPQEELPF